MDVDKNNLISVEEFQFSGAFFNFQSGPDDLTSYCFGPIDGKDRPDSTDSNHNTKDQSDAEDCFVYPGVGSIPYKQPGAHLKEFFEKKHQNMFR